MNSVPDFGGGKPLTEADAMKLYEKETELEHKPYPEFDPGGTGLKVCKAAKDLGLISRYTHAFSVEHASRRWCCGPSSPVSTGTRASIRRIPPVVSSRSPRAPPSVAATRSVADQIELQPSRLVLEQLGKEFGLGGRFCMTFDTWDQLLQSRVT